VDAKMRSMKKQTAEAMAGLIMEITQLYAERGEQQW
jgi:hypothetical protein